MDDATFTVDIQEALSAQDFRDTYFHAAKPVLLRGLLRALPACSRWSPEFFARRFGQYPVEVMRTADGEPDGASPYRGTHRVAMAAFARRMSEGAQGLYLVAQNQLLQRPAFAPLWDDLTLAGDWFRHSDAQIGVSLWMGPAGTVTPLHRDLQDVMIGQIYGTKRVILAPSADTPCVYKGPGGYAGVDPERLDVVRFPLAGPLRTAAVTIDAGDALFVPFGCWHHVRALTPSISLSMSNFAWACGPAT